MDCVKYFKGLSKELQSVQDRIRNLIGGAHWPSDGAWKESMLRSVLRRYLPSSFSVGSGFIITPEGTSTQIDMLICDDSAPLLFRDGDFIIATADCVRAVVEVKTTLRGNDLMESLVKLDGIAGLMRRRCVYRHPFFGVFCYNPTTTAPEAVLDYLQRANGAATNYEIQALCFGDRQFYRFWEFEPPADHGMPYNSWHAYDLPEMAPGYFVHNLIEVVFPQSFERAQNMWYPLGGKETSLVGCRRRTAREESSAST